MCVIDAKTKTFCVRLFRGDNKIVCRFIRASVCVCVCVFVSPFRHSPFGQTDAQADLIYNSALYIMRPAPV